MTDLRLWRNMRIRATGRASRTLVDQIASSGTNFLMVLSGARTLDPEEFGRVAVATVVVFLFVAVQRAAIGEPLLVSAGPSACTREMEAVGFGLAAALSAVMAASCLALGGVFPALALLIPLAWCSPLIVLQDYIRYVAFTRQRPEIALISDVVWAVVQAAAFLLLSLHLIAPTGTSVVTLWCVGAGVGLVAVVPLLSVRPSAEFHLWRRELRGYPIWSTAQVVGGSVLAHAATLLLAGIVGLDGVGGLRAMSTLLQPLGLVLTALIPILVPRLQAVSFSRREFLGTVARYSTWLALSAMGVTSVIVVFGRELTALVLGTHYLRFVDLLLVLAAAYVVQAAGAPVGAGLRTKNLGRSLFVTQMLSSTIGLVFVLVLATAWGILGASVGLLIQASSLFLVGRALLWRGS